MTRVIQVVVFSLMARLLAEVVAVEPELTQSDSGGAMGVSVLLLGLFGLRRRTKKSSI